MDGSGSHQSNQSYYDEFAKGYERHRGENDPGGYHEMLDRLEAEYVEQFGKGRDVLEAGCGTGLVLERIARFARSAQGVDLSPRMLDKARDRGLHVTEGSLLALPFDDASFDVCCAFKVLAHIPEIDQALEEMTRVVRPGGVILAEFYNPRSLRGAVKRLGPHLRVGESVHEGHVFTRFDTPESVRNRTPKGCEFLGARGIRIVTPTAWVMKVPVLRACLRVAESSLCDTPLSRFAGFYVAAYRKKTTA